MPDKKPRPGLCAGCRQQRDLHFSHILPKLVYRRARKTGGGTPVTMRDGAAVQIDDELRQHLLCHDCESILASRGERPAGMLLYRADGDCPLYKLLGFKSFPTNPVGGPRELRNAA